MNGQDWLELIVISFVFGLAGGMVGSSVVCLVNKAMTMLNEREEHDLERREARAKRYVEACIAHDKERSAKECQ